MELATDDTWRQIENLKSVTIASAVLLAVGIVPTDIIIQKVVAASASIADQYALTELDRCIGAEKAELVLAMLQAINRTAGYVFLRGPPLQIFTDGTLYNKGDRSTRSRRLEDCHVRPRDFAAFCLENKWDIPAGLAALGTVTQKTAATSSSVEYPRYPWAKRGRELGKALLSNSPQTIDVHRKIAPQVAEQLFKEGYRSRSGKRLSEDSVYRHALQRLRDA